MNELYKFGWLEYPLAIHFPSVRLAVLEIYTATDRDTVLPEMSIIADTPLDITKDWFAEQFVVGKEKYHNPPTVKMCTADDEWNTEPFYIARSIMYGAGGKAVFFFNLGRVKSKNNKNPTNKGKPFKIKIRQPGNVDGTVWHGAYVGARWHATLQHRNNHTLLFLNGWLPGNTDMFAVYYYDMGITSANDAANKADIQEDAAAIKAQLSADHPEYDIVEYTYWIDDWIPVQSHHPDVLYFEFQCSTYEGTDVLPKLITGKGSVGWAVEMTAESYENIKVFGQSDSGNGPLQPATWVFTVDLEDLTIDIDKEAG